MLINSVNMAIDKIFVARGAGILALSGVTVSLGVYLVLQGFSLLLAAGSASAIALGLGKDDKKGAENSGQFCDPFFCAVSSVNSNRIAGGQANDDYVWSECRKYPLCNGIFHRSYCGLCIFLIGANG